MNDMKLYHNNLTLDKYNAKQKLRKVEYHTLGTSNTTKHDGKPYLIMSDCALYIYIDYQLTKKG